MATEKTFTLQGKQYTCSDENVKKALRKVKPGPIQKYYIEIDGQRYPVKQALAAATGLSLAAFTSQYAFRILQSLGFEVQET